MNNKKIILSLLMIFLVALSLSTISAIEVEDNATLSNSDKNNLIASSEETALGNTSIGSTTYNIPKNYTNSQIQGVIDGATSGDKIVFEAGDYENISLTVDKKLIFSGTGNPLNESNYTTLYGDSKKNNDIFNVMPSQTTSIDGTSFYNLKLVMTNPVKWNGIGIYIEGGKDNSFENCVFENGSAGIYIRNNKKDASTGGTIVKNCRFTGVTNITTLGKKEVGTKAINIMGGDGINVTKCNFTGELLDGVSIASGARNINVNNNNFNENYYGVFFGGGITNINADNNVFNKCKVYAMGLKKAAYDTNITNNTFIMTNKTQAIYLEQGNTDHGSPTNIKNVCIEKNNFKASIGENPFSMEAVYVLSNGGPLKVTGILSVVTNSLTGGIKLFTFFDKNWKDGNDIIIKPDLEESTIVGNNSTMYFADKFNIKLIGGSGTILPDQDVVFKVIDAENRVIDTITTKTDINGIATINMIYEKGNYLINIVYAGTSNFINNAQYKGTSNNYTVNLKYYDAIISGKNITVLSAIGNKFTVVLKDSNNKIIANKNVTFVIHGRTYNRLTDENGVAGLNINLNRGNYTISASYDGGNTLNPVKNIYNVNVVQGMTQLIGQDQVFTNKGTAYKVQLVDANGKPIAGKAVAIHIYGVAYYRDTDENGFAYLNINLRKGIYNIYTSFDGTYQYKGCTAGNQITTTWL